jgi:hypothetical protein
VLKILLIEKDPVDAAWITELIKEKRPTIEVVHSASLPHALSVRAQQRIDSVFVSARPEGDAASIRSAVGVPADVCGIDRNQPVHQAQREATIVPRPELPWLAEPEEQPVMMGPVAEVMMLEMRHMAEPEHEVAIVELEHETALAEVTEVSRLEVWDMSGLECETTVAEVPEVPRLEGPRLSQEAPVVELEAMVSQVQLRASVPREMAKTEAAVTSLGWLRRHAKRRQDGCEQHDLAHRVTT